MSWLNGSKRKVDITAGLISQRSICIIITNEYHLPTSLIREMSSKLNSSSLYFATNKWPYLAIHWVANSIMLWTPIWQLTRPTATMAMEHTLLTSTTAISTRNPSHYVEYWNQNRTNIMPPFATIKNIISLYSSATTPS